MLCFRCLLHDSLFFFSLVLAPIVLLSLLSCGILLVAERSFCASEGNAYAKLQSIPFLLRSLALAFLLVATNWCLGLSFMVAKKDYIVLIFAATNILQGIFILPFIVVAVRTLSQRKKTSGGIKSSKILACCGLQKTYTLVSQIYYLYVSSIRFSLFRNS